MSKILSILIPTLPARIDKLHRLVSYLNEQVVSGKFEKQVQLLIDGDSKEVTIGAKRNRMVSNAIGKYVVFIDEDDMVSKDYISTLLLAAESNNDVITFNGEYINGNQPPKKVVFDINLMNNYNSSDTNYRLPNHICAIKKAIADKVRFKDLNFGEDSIFGDEVKHFIKNQNYVDKILYYYLYDAAKSQTRPNNTQVTAFKE